MTKVALFGAGGKMGGRITENMMRSEFDTMYVEISPAGIEKLKAMGLSVTDGKKAAAAADAVVLAVPDAMIRKIADEVTPSMKTGAVLIVLDVAAYYVQGIPERNDLAYLVTHPSHTSRMFKKKAQSLMNVLLQGTQEQYDLGDRVARAMHAPIGDSFRLTLEQMAILEPILGETIGVTMAYIVQEAIEEAVKMGVPKEPAIDFAIGHIAGSLQSALYGTLWCSEGCMRMVEYGKKHVFRENWKNVFTRESLREQTEMIVR